MCRVSPICVSFSFFSSGICVSTICVCGLSLVCMQKLCMKLLGGCQVSCSVTISLETGSITDAGAKLLPIVLESYSNFIDSFPTGSGQQFPAIMREAPCSSPALQKIVLVFSHSWNLLAPWRLLCPSPIPLGGHMETQNYSGSCHRFPGFWLLSHENLDLCIY